MTAPTSKNHLRSLYDRLVSGEIDRRAFIKGASALGISATGAVFLANTGVVAAQDSTPDATPEPVADRPDIGTEGQERGAGGELRLIQWQAPTSLSPHVATGSKDFLGAMLVVEPLMHYSPDSVMLPNLITEVPSVDNG
ncbi:MAG TPA: hypothetical protein VNZ55_04070, partial [Thermomicrobiales bacterium]|nr:hypothetical protein [Thermomicrobiales bacterium]